MSPAATVPKDALFVVDVQASFEMPAAIIEKIAALTKRYYTIATVERHDEAVTPFERQLGWRPGVADECMIPTDRVFIKHGYLPPAEAIQHLKERGFERVLVCGMQADTCCLAAGFMLFDAGLHPTLLKWLSVGSSLDVTTSLGARLWKHHFGSVLYDASELNLPPVQSR
ncbi:MAG TPA: cysteine hydrolase family protein [Acidobacteriaceae bacterium]